MKDTNEKAQVGRITFGHERHDPVTRNGIYPHVDADGAIHWLSPWRRAERLSSARAKQGYEQRGEHVTAHGIPQRQGPAQVSDQEELLNLGLPHGDPVGELHGFRTPVLVAVTQKQLDSWAIPTAAEAHGDI